MYSTRTSHDCLLYGWVVTPRARMREGVKQSVLSVSQSVCQSSEKF